MNRTDRILVVLLALGVIATLKLWSLAGGVDVLVHTRVEDTQLAASRWREIEGVATSLTTYREAGEDEAAFVDRHLAAMRKMRDALKAEPEAERIEHR